MEVDLRVLGEQAAADRLLEGFRLPCELHIAEVDGTLANLVICCVDVVITDLAGQNDVVQADMIRDLELKRVICMHTQIVCVWRFASMRQRVADAGDAGIQLAPTSSSQALASAGKLASVLALVLACHDCTVKIVNVNFGRTKYRVHLAFLLARVVLAEVLVGPQHLFLRQLEPDVRLLGANAVLVQKIGYLVKMNGEDAHFAVLPRCVAV